MANTLGIVSVDDMLAQMTPHEFRERLALRVLEQEEMAQATTDTPQEGADVEAQLDAFTRAAGF